MIKTAARFSGFLKPHIHRKEATLLHWIEDTPLPRSKNIRSTSWKLEDVFSGFNAPDTDKSWSTLPSHEATNLDLPLFQGSIVECKFVQELVMFLKHVFLLKVVPKFNLLFGSIPNWHPPSSTSTVKAPKVAKHVYCRVSLLINWFYLKRLKLKGRKVKDVIKNKTTFFRSLVLVCAIKSGWIHDLQSSFVASFRYVDWLLF